MGSFVHPMVVVGPRGQVTVDALVDTEASYTWLAREVLDRLGITPSFRRHFALADGREVDYDMADAQLRLNGETRPCPVIFGDPGTEPLLGVVTLEIFGLGVDPLNYELIPVTARLKTAIAHNRRRAQDLSEGSSNLDRP